MSVSVSQDDMVQLERLVDREAKQPFPAYALWFFLGWLGAHRIYAGRKKSGLAMAALSLSLIGFPIAFFWWLADAVLLGTILSEERELLYDQQARLLLENRGIVSGQVDPTTQDHAIGR
jgi:TM2 domain